jgi:hypothetical protein
MQDSHKRPTLATRTDGSGHATDATTFAAKVAAMSRAEREAHFPTHSDGQVCR